MKNKYNISNFSNKEITNIWHNYVKSSDSRYLGEIYKIFNQIIYFVAYKILKDRNKALDVTQDVFEQLIFKRKKYAHVRNFSSWIYQLTKNEALKRLKKDKLFVAFEDSYMEEYYEFEIGESSLSEKLKLLESGISQLKGKNYSKIIQLELEGKNNEKIAHVLGRTEKYVCDRKHLAKKELATIIRTIIKSQVSTY